MRIWIDLSNSPHPLLFAPIARRLEALGHEIGVTARDNAQTVELALERWPDATIIGEQSPTSRTLKALIMGRRIRMLRRWARSFRADVALSHNSYAQIVAARALGLPVITAMDFEGQPANHLAFRLAHLVLLPEALRDAGLGSQGASERRTRFYPGFKEEVYLGDFEPDAAVLASIGVERDGRPSVVLRTPPSRATYHRFGNPLFSQVLELLGRKSDVQCIVLVRHPEQGRAVRALRASNLIVPERAIDSRSLMYHADLVIGAGGTMTREAALMGVPTYSIFAGLRPAVDRWLESQGKMKQLVDAAELASVEPRRHEPMALAELRARAAELVQFFAHAITAADQGSPAIPPLRQAHAAGASVFPSG